MDNIKLVCKICGKECKNWYEFAPHITKYHNLKYKEYYDKYWKTNEEGICIICGNETKFINVKEGYQLTCSHKCGITYTHQNYTDEQKRKISEKISNIIGSNEYQQRQTENSMKKWGVPHPTQHEAVKQKMLETNLLKHGAKNGHSEEVISKMKEKNQELYGVEWSTQREDVKEKSKKTMIEKYGVEHPLQNEEINNKRKRTNLYRFGTEEFTSTKEFDIKRAEYFKNITEEEKEKTIEKRKQTHLERYGVEFPTQRMEVLEKRKKTKLERYGDENFVNHKKAAQTRIKNGNESSSERKLRLFFEDNNIYYIPQYDSDNRYPFPCDFYLPDTDTFIEINVFWAHMGHFYDENSEEDNKALKELQSRVSINQPQFENTIYVWTIRDKLKHETAIQNSLNYVVLWNDEDIDNFINSYEINGKEVTND